MLFSFIVGAALIALLLWGISSLTFFYHQNSRELQSSFECGFDSTFSSQNLFSTRFFILGLLFLIFDTELSLLIPLIIRSNFRGIIAPSLILVVLWILAFGTLYEKVLGSLSWLNLRIKIILETVSFQN